MSGKDLLKLLLITYGFTHNVKILTYRGEGNYIGYDVYAESEDDVYHEADCEGLQFHIYEILAYMQRKNICPKTISNAQYTTSELLRLSPDDLANLNLS